jgi:hypothetical protein
MYRKSFAEQHPILLVAAVTFACVLVVAVAFACALVVAHWPIVLVPSSAGRHGLPDLCRRGRNAAIQPLPGSPATSPGSAGRLRALATLAWAPVRRVWAVPARHLEHTCSRVHRSPSDGGDRYASSPFDR